MNRFTILSLWALLALTSATAATVTTVAGTGEKGSSGENVKATESQIANPYGLTIGPDGALYFCEIDNHRVRRLDLKTGAMTTAAGNGSQGYSGDGGPATSAALYEPYEVRFDTAGNMYFVEMKNHIVRKVDAKTRTISTIAGTGEPGFSGDGGPATKAQLSQPHSISLDGQGSIYIADIRNNRIRRVDLKSGIISTFAGNGTSDPTPDGAKIDGTPLNEPRTIDFDGKGDMFLALRRGNAVYRIDMKAKTIHHIAGTGEQGYTGDGGPAKLAKLSGPKGIAVGPNGGVYIADTESHTIRRIDLRSGIITTVMGDGTNHDGPDGDPLKCGLARPHGVFVDAKGAVWVGDSENDRVRVLR